MSKKQIQLWFNPFKEGREDLSDHARTGRPSMSTTDENIEAEKQFFIFAESLSERRLMILAYRSTRAAAKFQNC